MCKWLNISSVKSSVTSMLNTLRWNTLQQRRLLFQAEMIHKIHHGIVNIRFHQHITPVTSFHHLRTHRLSYHQPKCRVDCYLYSFYPRSIRIWNMLPLPTVMITNNNNNNRFLYSAFPNYDQSASQCIITPVIGFRHNSALRVHFLHSLGSIPASRSFTGAHNANSTTITFASYQVPIYTPGWRAAMWIKCLAEGQKCRALTGIEPGTL